MFVPTDTRIEGPAPEISCAPEVKIGPDEFAASALFRNWLERSRNGWAVEQVHVLAALAWNDDVRMAFVNLTGLDPSKGPVRSSAFLRGGTVDILPVVVGPNGDEFAVLVEQSRFPVTQIVVSTPAGMVDDDSAEAAALKELDEEVGGRINWSHPLWLNAFATGSDEPMLVSPGGSDETVQFCTVRADVTAEQMDALNDSVTGLAKEHEFLGVRLVPIGEARRYLARNGRPDMKSVLSLMLYEASRQQAR